MNSHPSFPFFLLCIIYFSPCFVTSAGTMQSWSHLDASYRALTATGPILRHFLKTNFP